jgi:hypothetical protein
MDSLSVELHLLIISFLNPCEWSMTKYATYRLINRRCAQIGAQKMFYSFQFRPTTATLERMRKIINAGLAQWVVQLDCEGEHYNREGTYSSLHRTVFQEVVLGFARAKSPITQLGGVSLDRAPFLTGNITPAFLDACVNLTHLDLHFNRSMGRNTGVHDFVQRLEYLQILTISSCNNDKELVIGRNPEYIGKAHDLPVLTDYMPLYCGKLRFLSLEQFGITEEETIALLRNHAGTLTSFNFQSCGLVGESKEAWRRIFGEIGRMTRLREGKFVSLVGDGEYYRERGWKVVIEGQGREVEIETNNVRWLEDKGQSTAEKDVDANGDVDSVTEDNEELAEGEAV